MDETLDLLGLDVGARVGIVPARLGGQLRGRVGMSVLLGS